MSTIKGYIKTFKVVTPTKPGKKGEVKTLTVIHVPDAENLVIVLESDNRLRVTGSHIIPFKFTLIRVIDVPTELIRVANTLRESQTKFNKHINSFVELFTAS